ncbi:transglutaminase [Halobacteriales archaeon SW_10_66_29]|nr:MAG: transglutaminase [Halobacteriales archaeon SW_10_66_29]
MSRSDRTGRWLPVGRIERAGQRWVPGWDRLVGVSLVRAGALAAAGGLLLSFLLVLYDVVATVGEPALFYPAVGLPLLGATLLARSVGVRTALGIGAALLAVGLAYHTATLDGVPDPLLIIASNVELLTGRRVLEIRQAGVWALAVTPTPVFVTWYLTLRREYVGAAAAGGATLGYLILTGDAGTTIALLGVVSVAALVGFGDLDNREWAGGTPDYVAAVLALMVVTPLVITIVPGGAASPVTFVDDEGTTMEDNVVGADSDLQIVGSVDQSPDVRFTVEADRARYWRTGSFDRYTGDGWVRSGGESAYGGDLEEPPGETEFLLQRVDAETELEAVPAAWRPVEVSTSVADRTQVTENGGLQLDGSVGAGESYQVVSAVVDPTAQELNDTGTDYPDAIVERYTQLPSSTPDRVGKQTAELVSAADTPYEAARLIEQWLRTNKEYSLSVNRPDGNIADSFLFEMEAGYCTYYATTMATMLRSQGIPARMAVGYNAGEPVGDDRYAVRGLNSHAWVEVYFPDVGWVSFDPTPPNPRQQVEQAAIQNARASGSDTVDTGETEPEESGPGEIEVPTEERNGTEGPTSNPAAANNPAIQQVPGAEGGRDGDVSEIDPAFEDVALGGRPGNGSSNATDIDEGAGGSGGPPLPPHEQLALGAVALIGAVAGLRQSRVVQRVSQSARIRYQRRSDPATDLERAHERLLLLLERRHRPRRDGETVRQYLDAIDAGPRARRVAELRERARYAGDVSKTAADEAVSLVGSIREDR